MIEVSFVVTNYNYGMYIKDAIDSIINLRSDNYEFSLLIGDDCSTDEFSKKFFDELDEKYSKFFKKIVIVRNERNLGKNNLLNQLIPQIETDLTVILDSDDMLADNFLTVTYPALNSLKEEPNIGFVYSDCILVNKQGEKISKGKSTEFSVELLQNYSFIPQTNLIYTKALKDALPLNENVRVGTKHHKWKKICAKGWKGKYIDEPLFFYRMHKDNISSIGEKVMSEEENNVKDRILKGYWPVSKD